MKIRTFISGEYTFPVYHHYRNLKARVPQILGDAFQVVRQTEHYETLEYWDYQGVDVVVLSTDEWVPKSGTQAQQAQAILHYVAMGGGLVFMHNLDLGGDVEMAQMLGGRLRTQLWGRPQDDEPVLMRYEPVEHPISRGIQPFEALDNRHQIHFDNLTPRQVFLNARLPDGSRCPPGGRWSSVWVERCSWAQAIRTARWITLNTPACCAIAHAGQLDGRWTTHETGPFDWHSGWPARRGGSSPGPK